MHRNFYRFFSIMCGISLCSSSAYADSSSELLTAEPILIPLAEDKLISDADSEQAKRKDQDKKFDSRLSKLETDMQKVKTETAYGNFGAKTASANPQLDGLGFFATADFLWWKLYEGGTEYVVKSNSISPIQGKAKQFNFNWEPGFKVGAGYVFEHDACDAYIEYTYFKTHARNSTSANFLFPLVGNEGFTFNRSKAHWNVHFQNIDVVVGKSFFVSRFFSLRPFGGLATSWMDQHRYFRFSTLDSNRIALKSKNDFWGIGPRLGLNTRLFYNENLSFYGNLSGNLLWGNFLNKERENNKSTGVTFYNLRYQVHRMVPNAAIGIGAVFEDNFADDAYHFMIKVGYESQYWWRQNQLPEFDGSTIAFHTASEDIGMQGLTVELRLDF